MLLRHILVVGVMFATAQGVSAASITVNAGVASVSVGSGFSPVASGSQIPAGAKVIVSQGGSASITYGSCVLSVTSGQVVTVPSDSVCFGAAPIPTTTLLIGGAVIAGGVGAAIALSGDDKKAISP